MTGWRDLFRTKPPPLPEEQQCSFCRKARAEVHALVAGPGVSICEACVVIAGAVVNEAARRQVVWPGILVEMAVFCPVEDAPRLLEPLTRAACALAADNVTTLRDLARRLAETQTAVHARAVLVVSHALGAARDLTDTERMVVAALQAGDLDAACQIEHPASTSPFAIALAALSPLVRACPGDPEIDEHAARVREAVRDLPADAVPSERVTVTAALALAEQRCGRAAGAVVQYAPLPPLQPWHELAHGDARHATGDEEGAVAAWQRVASDPALPYWAEQARERLGRIAVPYRS